MRLLLELSIDFNLAECNSREDADFDAQMARHNMLEVVRQAFDNCMFTENMLGTIRDSSTKITES